MFKNREFVYSFIFIIIVMGISVIICVAEPSAGIYVVLADGAVFLVCFWRFGVYIYKRLRRLSQFLRKAQNQMPPLEVPDQLEGELSVLKSELYKLLTAYYTQSELLTKDKKYLADAISDISHQLKTPMTSMKVMIDLLKEDKLPKEKRMEFTDTLHRQMTRMEWLLSSILTMSRLDAGAIVLKKETVMVSEMIEKALEHLLIPMELHGQKLIVESGETDSYKGDLYWSSEAVSNIVKNCMEHTPDGGIITIKSESNPIYTGIYIQDQGGGISEKDLPHIFERFYKGEHASPDSAGIGLALAKQIITGQNGTLDLETVYGESTTFVIRFYHLNM